MMNEAIPKLRFKGFRDEWVPKKLKDISTVKAGGDVNKQKLLKHGKYPVLSNGLGINSIEGYYSDYKIKAPAITVTGRGKLGIAKSQFVSFTPVVRLISIQSNKLDVIFGANVINKLHIFKEYTGVPQLTAKQLKNYYIIIPSLPEQRQIGTFFAALDQLIQLQQKKVALLKRLKKAYLQKLFPRKGESVPRIRFKGFHDQWNTDTLKNLYNRCDNLRKPVSANKRIKGNIPYYGANGIEDYVKGYTCNGCYVLIAEDGANNITNYPVYITNGKFWVNNHTHVLSAKKSTSIYFLAYAIKQLNMKTYLVGGGRFKLRSNDLMNIRIKIPSLREQTVIGNFLNKFDNDVSNYINEENYLHILKKSYLQKMFC